jgi:drug/metabolite transporter (DMT)-like permease
MMVYQTSPFFAALLGLLILKERIMWFEYLAIVVCFGSVTLVAMSKPTPEESDEPEVIVEEDPRSETWGIICILYSACCVAGISLV